MTTATRSKALLLARLLALILAGFALPAAAADSTTPAAPPAGTQDSKGTLLHPKVDKPIPDTYEPLGGTRWEDRDEGTGEIRESWKLKQAEKDKERAAREKAAEEKKDAPPLQKDIRIQDIVPDAPTPAASTPAPTVEKSKDSIQIHGQ